MKNSLINFMNFSDISKSSFLQRNRFKNLSISIIFLIVVGSFLSIIDDANAYPSNISVDTANSEIKNLNYIDTNGNHVISPYRLTQNATAVTVETREGSYVFNSNSCSLSTFASGLINGTQPLIKSDSYQVLASNTNNGTTNWNPVNVINNAQCNITVQSNATSVSITGTKSVTGAGTFSVTYTKTATKPLKITFSATNNNPIWTNYHVSLRETLSAPQFVTMGNTTYNLSQYNNIVLDRNWIANHRAQVIAMYSNLAYDMGIGYNHVNQMIVHWINGKASIDIDYTYNTPILSPGQTITIDPSIALDTGNCNTFASGTSSTLSFTVASHSNRMMVISVMASGGFNLGPIKYGTQSFTTLRNQSDGLGGNNDMFYLASPTVGTANISVTSPTSQGLQICAATYYNVQQSSTFGTGAGSGTNTGTYTQSITTTKTNSWVISGTDIDYSTPPTGGVTANAPTVGDGVDANHIGAIGHVPTTSIGSYTASWTTSGGTNIHAVIQAMEMKLFNQTLTVPVLSKVNTLNSTAINATWSASVGANWYWLNATLSGGATTHINTTNTFVLLNNYTAGSKYTFSLVAANSTTKSASSITKYNYTTNIAPTAPTISSILTTTSTISVTPPSGNVSGYKVYVAPVSTGVYALSTTTSTSATSISLTGLIDDTAYTAKVSTRYGLGSNYSGSSANSTVVNWSTIPNPPTGLAVSQSVVNVLHLTWTLPTGLTNPILGYKIERSTDYGATWIVLVANTGNTATTYDDSGLSTGSPYTYRISAITVSGTSLPTAQVSATVLSAIQLNPTGSTFSYNTTVPIITWHVMARNNTNWDMFIDTSNNGTAVSWYHAIRASSTITKILGYGTSSFSITNTPNNFTNNDGTFGYGFQSNNGWLYFANNAKSIDHYYIGNGTKKHDFTFATDCKTGIGLNFLLVNQNSQPVWGSNTDSGACNSGVTTLTQGNTTLGFSTLSGKPQAITSTTNASSYVLWEFNNTVGQKLTPTSCAYYQINNNFTQTTLPDTIACDWSIQQTIKRYYSGLPFFKQGNVYSTNAQDLFSATDALGVDNKLLMTVDNNILGIPTNTPNARFILHTTGGDYLVIVTSSNIYYQLTSTILQQLQSGNRAYENYIITPFGTTLPFQLSSLTSKHGLSIYANGLNTTNTIMGMSQLISGYTYRGTTLYGYTRNVDPQWTNDQTDIPLITTTSSLFPIYLTVSNAPTNSGLMVTNPAYTIESIGGIWTVTALDATRTAEFDIPAGQCGLVYIADISSAPSIWNYEGQVCATGTNQKTVTYVNTLPTNFFTLRYGVTDSYTPSTNGLTTSFHTTVPGTTYTVDIKNSTGAIAQTYTFTVPTNTTIDTQHYNVSNVAKPAGLFVSVGGNQIYSAYLGSPLSLASVATFFHQYLSYQGFDLLSFIPLVFASMFTRNTVGIGAALTVVLIATLSFLSIVVIPDPVIYIGIIIAIIGMIGYRAFGY